MKNHFLKLSLILSIFIVNESQCAYKLISEEQSSFGIISLIAGAAFVTGGVLKAYNIPTTSTEEVSLCLQNRLSKENLKKVQLGRNITAYCMIGAGALATIIGLGALIGTVKIR